MGTAATNLLGNALLIRLLLVLIISYMALKASLSCRTMLAQKWVLLAKQNVVVKKVLQFCSVRKVMSLQC